MFCPNCGMQLSETATSCASCGQIITQRPSDNIVQQPIMQDIPQNSIKKPTFSKNKIVIIAVALVVLVGAFLGISSFLKGDSKQQEITAYFDPNKPIRIKENNLYGYIDSNGKTIIAAQYKNANEFVDKYAVVQLPADENSNEYYAIIDNKGKVVLNTMATYGSSIEYLSEYEVWYIQGRLYNKNLSPITSEGLNVSSIGNGYFSFMESDKVGIMTASGKITYSMATNGEYLYFAADTDDRGYEDLKELYCQTNISNEKYGVVNCKTGKVVIDYSDKYISADDNNIFQISDKNTYEVFERVYIANDKIAYRLTDKDSRIEYIGNSILEIRDNDYKYTYFDVKNNKTLDQKPSSADLDVDDVMELLTGFKEFRCDEGGYGVKKGEQIIIPCGWDSISYVSDPLYSYAESKGKQLIYTKKDGKMNLYDIKSNKVIVNFNTSYLSGDYGDSVFVYYKDADTKRTVVYNVINGKQLDFDENVSISNESNYFTVKKDNKLEYYNTDFKHIYTGSVS